MNRSESINELATALSKAQGEMPKAKQSGLNKHFGQNYATLDDLREASIPALSKNGLVITQTTVPYPEGVRLITTIIHSSGQWISGEYPIMAARQDPQGLKSAMTYAKRTTWEGICGLSSGDAEDDGNTAQGKTETPQQPQKPQAPSGPPAQQSSGPTEPQLKRLFAITKQHNWTQEQLKGYMLAVFNIDSTKKLTKFNYDLVCKIIETKSFDQAMSELNLDDGRGLPPQIDEHESFERFQ